MKKLNRSFLKKFNSMLIVLLAVFGFSTVFVSCEYGAPYNEFAVKKEVVSENVEKTEE